MFLNIILRIGHSILVFAGLIVLLFFVFNILGDPISFMADQDAPQETVDALRQEFGLDRPLYVRFADFLWDSVRFDFGTSIGHRIEVRELLLDRLPNTIVLLQLSWILGAIGIPLGLLAAKGPREFGHRPGNTSSLAGGAASKFWSSPVLILKWLADRVVNAFTFIAISMVEFWLALLLILILAVQMDWLPTSGFNGLGAGGRIFLVMPVIALCLRVIARDTQITRAAMLMEIDAQNSSTSPGMGPGKGTLKYGKVLQRAVLSKIALIGDELPLLFSGELMVETIFGWPGIGQLALDAMNGRDLPLIVSAVLIIGFLLILVNLVLDLALDLIPGMAQENAHSGAFPIGAMRLLRRQPVSQALIATRAGHLGDATGSIEHQVVVPRQPASPPVPLAQAFLRDPVALISGGFLFLVLLVAVFAPLVAPYDPLDQQLRLRHSAPMSSGMAQDRTVDPPLEQKRLFVLGTDHLGRDYLSRLIFGARPVILVSSLVVLVSALFGVVPGLLSGYFGGVVDYVIMWAVDLFTSMPSLLLAFLVLFVLGPSLVTLVIAIAVTRWTMVCMVTRGAVMSWRGPGDAPTSEQGDRESAGRQIASSLVTPLLLLAVLEIPRNILLESTISFLGVGIQPPGSSWGIMLSQGRQYIVTAWWVVITPGVAIFLTVLCLNFLGSWLRAVKDPIQRWRWL